MKNCRRHRVFFLGAALLVFFSALSSRANVYATNIKLNGSLTNDWIAPGYPAHLTYILNEPATGGALAKICLGTNVIRTFSATNGQPGALAGTNAWVWDGKNDGGSNAPPGLYSIQISAYAQGYADWTNITDDSENFEVDSPRGVDVNKNTNSPYYGRVYVGNNGGGQPAGIFKFNADGSAADEGGFSTGGYGWAGDGYSPWKIAVSAEDVVCVNDWSFLNFSRGLVFGFDPLITSGDISGVLGSDNYTTANEDLSGPYLTGAGTNEVIWMADAATNGSQGILYWNLQADGTTAFSDPGTVGVCATNSALTAQVYDVAVGTNGFIFTIQRVDRTNDPANRVLCFPPCTNGASPQTVAAWAAGAGDPALVNAYGVDVNRAGTVVAVASRGYGSDPSALVGGNVSLFSAGNGHLLKRLGYGVDDQYTDVAWDAVGNLYALDYSAQVWRAYSPPGTNQAMTVAVGQLQMLAALNPPQLLQPVYSNGQFSVLLHGQSNVTYEVQLSTDLVSWSTVATNFATMPDRFVTLPETTDAQDFYRALVQRN